MVLKTSSIDGFDGWIYRVVGEPLRWRFLYVIGNDSNVVLPPLTALTASFLPLALSFFHYRVPTVGTHSTTSIPVRLLFLPPTPLLPTPRASIFAFRTSILAHSHPSAANPTLSHHRMSQAYQPPSAAAGSSRGPTVISTGDVVTQDRAVRYICGDCDAKVTLKSGESNVRCKDCGHRVLYKERTNR